MSVAHEQSLQIASLTAMQDTVPWDPPVRGHLPAPLPAPSAHGLRWFPKDERGPCLEPPRLHSNSTTATRQIVNSLVDGHGLHLAPGAAAPPSSRLSHTSSRSLGGSPMNCGTLQPLSAPSTDQAHQLRAPSPLSHASKQENHTCASVLLVGTSMIRHVALHGGRTFCHPGTWVKEVTTSALQLSEQHCTASTMVLEAGINNLRFQQSEILKQDFATMIDRLLATEKRLMISGPPRQGDIITSRLRQLHLRLKGYCLMKSIPFVDNIFVFLNRPHLFKSNGLHPNQEGSRLQSVNINLTVRSCTTATS